MLKILNTITATARAREYIVKSQINATPQYVWKLTPHSFCCNFSPLTRSLTIYTEAPESTKLNDMRRMSEIPESATC